MSTSVSEIEKAVTQLSSEELRAFRAWYAEFDARAWDAQFEVDVEAGRLDALCDEALREDHQGGTTDL